MDDVDRGPGGFAHRRGALNSDLFRNVRPTFNQVVDRAPAFGEEPFGARVVDGTVFRVHHRDHTGIGGVRESRRVAVGIGRIGAAMKPHFDAGLTIVDEGLQPLRAFGGGVEDDGMQEDVSNRLRANELKRAVQRQSQRLTALRRYLIRDRRDAPRKCGGRSALVVVVVVVVGGEVRMRIDAAGDQQKPAGVNDARVGSGGKVRADLSDGLVLDPQIGPGCPISVHDDTVTDEQLRRRLRDHGGWHGDAH